MDEDGAAFAGFDGGGPFRVTPEAGGVSLESALRDYGPAAIDDLIPRLRAIARRLDAAHASGAVHGTLHPSKVIVYDTDTSLIAGATAVLPYAAPELADGGGPTAASDQYSFAAIAYEWLFGRPINHPADRAVEVRTMPGVDRAALSKAFTRALAPGPRDRFVSCTAFCEAIAHAVVPELPLLALDVEDQAHDPVEPFIPEAPIVAPMIEEAAAVEPDLDSIDRVADAPVAAEKSFDSDRDVAVLAQDTPSAWNPAPTPPPSAPQRFGGTALILATLVGSVFGFAAGYMARPRALQGGPPQEMAVAKNAEPASPATTTAVAPVTEAAKTTEAPKTAQVGRLLVRSTPNGANVTVDGVAKGVTPLALRDLEMGTRTITVGRRGYVSAARKVVITSSRPARTLDIRLVAEVSGSPKPKPATPATLGRPSVTTGGLNVDSRPVGAAVTINGTPRGNTPLSINDLAPGEYRILMTMPGYRNFATTVRVVAGERARAAASLTALEQQ